MTGDDVRDVIDEAFNALDINKATVIPLCLKIEQALPHVVRALSQLIPINVLSPYLDLVNGVLEVERSMESGLDAKLRGILGAVYDHRIITNLVARLFLSNGYSHSSPTNRWGKMLDVQLMEQYQQVIDEVIAEYKENGK